MSSDQTYYPCRYAEINCLAAICVRRNGVDSMYYVHPDRLGSYTHITNTNKQVIRNLHFDPWGNVKTDANWLAFDSTTLSGNLAGTFRFSRGFTGHEHYADLKIINMNGRLYDPVIARFFSPDNFVQAPGFTQSYNRYSYCLNNPLQYTDPSGEFWHLIVGAAIGGFLNVVLNANNIENCWQGLAYFGIGAVAGALSAGVGAGISTAFAGVGFSAGFCGTSSATVTGFLASASVGAASAATNGLITSTGNAWLQGSSFGDGLLKGVKTSAISGLVGGLTSGVIGGFDAVLNNRCFWSGNAKQFDLPENLIASIDNTVAYEDCLTPSDARVVNNDKYKVYYKPEDGSYGTKNYVLPNKYIKVPVDGVATSKTRDFVFKVPEWGRIKVLPGGDVEFLNPTMVNFSAHLANIRSNFVYGVNYTYGWMSQNQLSDSSWDMLFLLARLIKL